MFNVFCEVCYNIILSHIIRQRVLQVNYKLCTSSFDITDCRIVITLALKMQSCCARHKINLYLHSVHVFW